MTISSQTLAGKKPMQATAGAKTWTVDAVAELYELPFNDLLYRAQGVHREHFSPGEIELATLLSIKTGGCPEDCAYCPQAARYHTGVEAEKLLPLAEVVAAAEAAKQNGATRFCMGAAWREPKARDIEKVQAMVSAVKALGLETCATLGMLSDLQARQLKHAGLDYYNHNLDTAPEFYGKIITTRVYQERLDTLGHVREAGIKVCCGGIVGMGESRAATRRTDRATRQSRSLSRVGPDQPSGAGRGHAAARNGAARPARIRAHHRGRAHHHAARARAAVGRPARAGRGGAGAVFPRRRELDFLRRQAAYHRQSGG